MVGHLSLSSQPPEFYALLIGPQLVEIGPGSTSIIEVNAQAYDFSKMVLTSQDQR